MNENLDLTKILKYCPKGTILYSTLCGDVELDSIDTDAYPIRVKVLSMEYDYIDFTKDGRYYTNSPDAECVLFPSKDNRDWSTFKGKKEPKFKVGDFIKDDKFYFLVTNIADEDYVVVYPENWSSFALMPINDTDGKYELCTLDEVAMFKRELHKNGKHWSEKQKKLVHWYRPFERVLVRVDEGDSWTGAFFSHYDKDNDLFVLTTYGVMEEKDILPYEGNENKLGEITK